MKCPFCGKKISSKETFCPYCGYQLKTDNHYHIHDDNHVESTKYDHLDKKEKRNNKLDAFEKTFGNFNSLRGRMLSFEKNDHQSKFVKSIKIFFIVVIVCQFLFFILTFFIGFRGYETFIDTNNMREEFIQVHNPDFYIDDVDEWSMYSNQRGLASFSAFYQYIYHDQRLYQYDDYFDRYDYYDLDTKNVEKIVPVFGSYLYLLDSNHKVWYFDETNCTNLYVLADDIVVCENELCYVQGQNIYYYSNQEIIADDYKSGLKSYFEYITYINQADELVVLNVYDLSVNVYDFGSIEDYFVDVYNLRIYVLNNHMFSRYHTSTLELEAQIDIGNANNFVVSKDYIYVYSDTRVTVFDSKDLIYRAQIDFDHIENVYALNDKFVAYTGDEYIVYLFDGKELEVLDF